MLRQARRASAPDRPAWLEAQLRGRPRSDYDFLLGSHIDRATLDRACALAGRIGVAPHEVLIANGWLTADEYARALADDFAVSFWPTLAPTELAPLDARANPRDILRHPLLKLARANSFAVVADLLTSNDLHRILASIPRQRLALLASPCARHALVRKLAPRLAANATHGLAKRHPEQSAAAGLAVWQIVFVSLVVPGFAAWLLFDFKSAMGVASLLLGLAFIPIIALRVFALINLRSGPDPALSPASRIPDAELPIYTILAPLYREANVVCGLVAALARLDYPAAKLDIKLILEETDRQTLAAVHALDLPGSVEIVMVPRGAPRTKPKALNYALPLARGDYLVIYDAEDRPEPDQLRKALTAFHRGPANLGCVQASLSIYNAGDSWLTRQFALEYSALFKGLLPALAKLRWPMPLGGTSNHFRVSALKWLSAWDPFNVTEDADLGVRLARNGYLCQMLPSATFEEAPRRFKPWLFQRTRWLKGYLQTWLVHMRSPAKLLRELGPGGFLAFQIVVGGTVLSPLIHIWFYVMAGCEIARHQLLARPQSLIALPFWLMALLEVAAGYLASMALALAAARGRGLARHVALMPVYWLLTSVAAYRALWQFMVARFVWEKTEHGQARTVAPPLGAKENDATARDNGCA